MSSFAKVNAVLLTVLIAGTSMVPVFATHEDELWNYINRSSYIDPNVVNRMRKTHREPQLNLEITEAPDGTLRLAKPLSAAQKKKVAEQVAKNEPKVDRRLYVRVPRENDVRPINRSDDLALAFALPHRMAGVFPLVGVRPDVVFGLAGLTGSRGPGIAGAGRDADGPQRQAPGGPVAAAAGPAAVALLAPPLPAVVAAAATRRAVGAPPVVADVDAPGSGAGAARAGARTARTQARSVPPRVARKPAVSRKAVASRRSAPRRAVARRTPAAASNRPMAYRSTVPRVAPDFRRDGVAVRVPNPGKIKRTYSRIKNIIRRIF